MHKMISILLALAMTMAGSIALADMTPGTYTAEATGNNGPVKVEVTVDAAAIVDVKVTEHAETPGICDTPIADIPAAIVENQSVAVDAVSGATNTSKAIIAAVTDALTQAGADIAAFSVAAEKEFKLSEDVKDLSAD